MRDYLEQHEVITNNHKNHKKNDREDCVIFNLPLKTWLIAWHIDIVGAPVSRQDVKKVDDRPR